MIHEIKTHDNQSTSINKYSDNFKSFIKRVLIFFFYNYYILWIDSISVLPYCSNTTINCNYCFYKIVSTFFKKYT